MTAVTSSRYPDAPHPGVGAATDGPDVGEVDEVAALRDQVVGLRGQLTNLRALLVLAILMTESADEEQILRLAASSARSLGSWRIAGFLLGERWWPGTHGGVPMSDDLAAQLAALPEVGGPIAVGSAGWARACPMRAISGPLGHMVVYARREPSVDEQFLAKVVAQQTGVAVSNARLHRGERDAAQQLARTNEALEETVATLRRSMQIHERLTRVAASGEGSTGIADALHDLTGLPVAIEDRYGNLRAWTGSEPPEPYRKPSRYDRERLLARLRAEGRSVRDGERVVALASPRPGVLGVVALVDPGRRAGATDVIALEYGATVLAVELARLRSLADTELRVRRELIHDLLAGTDDDSAQRRAEALGYDLGRPHRVVLVECTGKSCSRDAGVFAVRRALRQQQLVALVGTMAGSGAGTVVIVAGGDADWEGLRQATIAQLGGGQSGGAQSDGGQFGGAECRLGVGDAYERPSELPRSLREAQLALKLQRVSSTRPRTSVFRDLDVFRMLASIDDLADVERFADRWLGELIAYDATKKTELVKTLTQYLQHGGGYETTSRALSVHRSTLKYRLQRIRELTGLDLTDPETHFNLQLATRAWMTLQALRS